MRHTHQSLVNTVVDWYLVQQKPPAVSDDGGCMYVSGETGCAIGIQLTPDQKHRIGDSHSNRDPVVDLMGSYQDIAEDFSECDMKFLDDLQECHDYSAATWSPDGSIRRIVNTPRDFRKILVNRLTDLCIQWNLTFPRYEEVAH